MISGIEKGLVYFFACTRNQFSNKKKERTQTEVLPRRYSQDLLYVSRFILLRLEIVCSQRTDHPSDVTKKNKTTCISTLRARGWGEYSLLLLYRDALFQRRCSPSERSAKCNVRDRANIDGDSGKVFTLHRVFLDYCGYSFLFFRRGIAKTFFFWSNQKSVISRAKLIIAPNAKPGASVLPFWRPNCMQGFGTLMSNNIVVKTVWNVLPRQRRGTPFLVSLSFVCSLELFHVRLVPAHWVRSSCQSADPRERTI